MKLKISFTIYETVAKNKGELVQGKRANLN